MEENNDINKKLLINGDTEIEKDDENLRSKVLVESKKLWVVAGPAIFTRFSTFGISIITQIFIGHMGATELAAYSLVFTVLLRFANGILLGMASALETLCGQAYGAKQYNMLGIYLQRSWLVLFITALFLLPVFLLTAPILKLLGQDEEIADVAGYISMWTIPVIFSFIFSFTCQMYLQAQSKNIIIAYVAASAIVVHISLMALMCHVRLGLELWYNSVLVLLTGNMINAKVAIDALAICLNINGWEMMISLGFLAAASVRVSNELGGGSSKGAKFAIVVSTLTSLTIGVVLFVFFLFYRGRLAYIFTTDEAVAAAVDKLSPLLAISILLNSVQPVLSGVAVGAGWQSIVAYVNLACYYLVGIPLGMILGYLINFQVTGIWMGMLVGTAVQTVVLVTITWRTDWDNQVVVARNRVRKWSTPEARERSQAESATRV
ncbi:hypothetical protein MKW92_012565 [Papaver armeniacum]|nr:hypothetical protein MKW92_012565 [Papaver armeniacum]